MSDSEVAGTEGREFELSLHQMTVFVSALRKLGDGAKNIEEAGQNIVDYLNDSLKDPDTGEHLCALVRLFMTYPFDQLSADLQKWGLNLVGLEKGPEEMKCLTLIATRGEQPEWNSRRDSARHQVIPFVSEQMVEGIPMISQLIKQLGLEIKTVLNPDPDFLLAAREHTFNVFHVAHALGSPYIPAQDDFVKPHGIRSVLGYGGIFPTGELFVVIMFWNRAISQQTADMFQPLALSTKVALLPFIQTGVFGEG